MHGKSRKFNLTHKKTDSPVYKRFELEVVKYFNKKNRTGCFGFQFIGLSAEEVRKRNEFKDVEILKNLEFSLNWTRRVAKNNNLLWTSRKSDATRRIQLKKDSQKKRETCKPNYQVILHQRNKAFYRNYEKLESPLFWIPKIANFCRKLPKKREFVILDFDCRSTLWFRFL